jgi:hypothetical protein
MLERAHANRVPRAARVFAAVEPVAKIPSCMESYRQGEASGRKRGHAEEKRSDTGSEEGLHPGRATGDVLERKDESDSQLRNRQAEDRR